MKLSLIDIPGATYTFNKTAGTVTISGLSHTLTNRDIFGIINTENNQILCKIDEPGYGCSVSGNIITLDQATTSMNDSDKLSIFLDIPSYHEKVGLTMFTYTSGNLTSIDYPDGSQDVLTYNESGDLATLTKS